MIYIKVVFKCFPLYVVMIVHYKFDFQVMAFGLFMMDNKDNPIYKMDQKKRINIGKIDKILKVIHKCLFIIELLVRRYYHELFLNACNKQKVLNKIVINWYNHDF